MRKNKIGLVLIVFGLFLLALKGFAIIEFTDTGKSVASYFTPARLLSLLLPLGAIGLGSYWRQQ